MGKVIANGPKCGRLFPIHISTPSPDMSLFASTIASKNNVQLCLWGSMDSRIHVLIIASFVFQDTISSHLQLVLDMALYSLPSK